MAEKRQLIGVLMKVETLLGILSSEDTPLGVTELALRTGMPKSTVFRLLHTLVEIKAVERHGRNYWIGSRHKALAAGQNPRHRMVRERLLPYAVDLHEQTHLPVCLVVLVGLHSVTLANIHGVRERVPAQIRDEVTPAHCTAPGKALLAYQFADHWQGWADTEFRASTSATITSPEKLRDDFVRIRRDGISISHDEFVPGVTAIAAPVLSRDRRPVAAIGLSGPTCLLSVAAAERSLRRKVHEAAAAVRELSSPTVPWSA